MITLLVENTRILGPDYKYPQSNIDFATLGDDTFAWAFCNKQVIIDLLDKSEFFKIISMYDIQNVYRVDELENVFYVLNVCNWDDIYKRDIFSAIPPKSVEYIKTNKIPIMIFSPFEYISHNFECEHPAVSFNRQLESLGLENNEIVFFSLPSFVNTYDGQQLSLSKINKNFKNFSWCPSVLFLTYNLSHKEPVKLKEHLENLKNKKYLFLCLNGAPRHNRQLLLQALYNNDLWKNNLISAKSPLDHNLKKIIIDMLLKDRNNNQNELINFLCSAEEQLLKKILAQANFNNELWNFIFSMYQSVNDEKIYPKQSLDDHIIGVTDEYNYKWDSDWYKKTWCSIVTETYDMANYESVMVTEKTLKAISNCHIFTTFSHPYTNKFLRKIGFITFEQSWFNLPKDGEIGNISMFERLLNLIKSLKKLSSLSHAELEQRFINLLPDIEHNFNHLTKNDWTKTQHDLIIKRVKSL